MEQLTFLLVEHLVSPSQLQDSEKDLKIQGETLCLPIVEFLTSLDPSGSFGKTCQVSSVQMEDGILVPSLGRWANSAMGGPIGCLMLNTLESPKDVEECLLSAVLEIENLPQKYYLSPKASQGVIRRAEERNKKLPPLLNEALHMVAQTLNVQTQ